MEWVGVFVITLNVSVQNHANVVLDVDVAWMATLKLWLRHNNNLSYVKRFIGV
jgi:hypothetical protein